MPEHAVPLMYSGCFYEELKERDRNIWKERETKAEERKKLLLASRREWNLKWIHVLLARSLHRSTLNDDAKADRVKEDENEGGRGHSIMDAFVA